MENGMDLELLDDAEPEEDDSQEYPKGSPSKKYYGEATGGSAGSKSLQFLIVERLNDLKARTLETGEILSTRIEHLQEAFILKCHERQKKLYSAGTAGNGGESGFYDQWGQPGGGGALEKTILDMKGRLSEVLSSRHALLSDKYPRTLNEIAALQGIILDEELTRWKRDQQLAGNTGHLNASYLDTIQSFCEDLIELIWINRNQLKELERLRLVFLERVFQVIGMPNPQSQGGLHGNLLDQENFLQATPTPGGEPFFPDSVLSLQQQQFFGGQGAQEGSKGKGALEGEVQMMLAFLKNGAGSSSIYLQEKITQLLSSLVTSTFIVEKQPPQVMKTNTRFTATVRLLTGGRLLNIYHGGANANLMSPPQVQVNIISEQQANSLLAQNMGGMGGVGSGHGVGHGKSLEGMNSGEIVNNRGTMEYHQQTRHLNVHFRNMQLKKIKRTEKKGTESVMDEKFSLHFSCQFTIGENKELIFKIWTLSLPVVVIVHGNQEPHAWATVTYDNAFGEPGRLPFQVPERVEWESLAATLNMKFKSMTGRGLSEENLMFLRSKVLLGVPANSRVNPGVGAHYHPHHHHMEVPSTSSPYSSMVTWSQFCKEPLPDRSFTFWEWFYSIMKLTREHLRGPWVDGSIIGFLPKAQAEEILQSPENDIGTFILRFSDSELGGVTIAWLHADRQVFSVAPFTAKDLSTRSLADRINDLSSLTFLLCSGNPSHPHRTPKGHVVVPKAHSFSKYYTPTPDLLSSMMAGSSGSYDSRNGGQGANGGIKGYVKPQLKTHIPLY